MQEEQTIAKSEQMMCVQLTGSATFLFIKKMPRNDAENRDSRTITVDRKLSPRPEHERSHWSVYEFRLLGTVLFQVLLFEQFISIFDLFFMFTYCFMYLLHSKDTEAEASAGQKGICSI